MNDMLGYEDKYSAYKKGCKKLHRAFSATLFNESGQMFIKRRLSKKLLFKNLLSSSVFPYPVLGESRYEPTEEHAKGWEYLMRN
jgi:isopentenyldiphosphate isomerase